MVFVSTLAAMGTFPMQRIYKCTACKFAVAETVNPIPLDSFSDYAIARKPVIASRLGERAKAWRQTNKRDRRSALFIVRGCLLGELLPLMLKAYFVR